MLGPLMISEHRPVVSSLWNEVAVDRAREMPVLMEIVDFWQKRGYVLTREQRYMQPHSF